VNDLDRIKDEINLDRRAFLKKMLAGAIGGSLLLVLPMGIRGQASDDETEAEGDLFLQGKRFVFIVDVTRCIGCGACCVADKSEYQVPDGFYRTWVERFVIDDQDNVFVDSPRGGLNGFTTPRSNLEHPVRDTFYVPKLCNMCQKPSCVQVCPVGASFRSPDGFVLVDGKRCVGCGYCVQACPYSVRYISPSKRTAEKCTWCYHRVRQDRQPACVDVCPVQARKFGDLNDKQSEVYKLLHEPTVISVLKPEMGNQPSLYYLGLRREVV